nr:brain and acute leukemia cytoplasmic protein-like [Paramormyrops kingsleyae]
MGCGGSKANAIEPRYYESWTRETETTWLTNTDTEVPQLGVINKNHGSAEKEGAATCAGKGDEGKQESAGASHRPKKMVNACTQCGKESLPSGTSTNSQMGSSYHEEVTEESGREARGGGADSPQETGVRPATPQSVK